MSGLAAAVRPLLAKAGTKHRLIAPSVLRICLGTLTLIYYALHVAQRNLLWGPDAVVNWHDAHLILKQGDAWTLYQLLPSQAGFEFLFWTGFLVTIAYTVGFATRISSVLFVLMTFSLYQRNYYAIDGGENLLIIMAFYLCFTDLSAISLDRKLGWAKPGGGSWFSGLMHNAAITACLAQLALLYFISDYFKIQGHVWANGTALYYILRTDEFSLPGWTDIVTHNEFLIVTGTYATIIFEAMYPWAIWHPKLKYVVLAGVVMLHGGIAIFMGLVWFSLTMLCVDALFFDDAEFIAIAKLWERGKALLRPRQPAVAEAPA